MFLQIKKYIFTTVSKTSIKVGKQHKEISLELLKNVIKRFYKESCSFSLSMNRYHLIDENRVVFYS